MGIFNFLHKRKTTNVTEPLIEVTEQQANETPNNRIYKPTHKKKETLMLDLFGGSCDPRWFSDCKNTPISVITINGKPVQDDTSFVREMTQFPNPGASTMAAAFPKWETIINAKSGNTVVRYLDKKTGEPVLMLFPQNYIYFYKLNKTHAISIAHNGDETIFELGNQEQIDEMSRLNHASLKDFFYQVQKRQNDIEKFISATQRQ